MTLEALQGFVKPRDRTMLEGEAFQTVPLCWSAELWFEIASQAASKVDMAIGWLIRVDG